MKNIKNSTKKWLTVAGCLAVCVILALLIGSRFQTGTTVDGQVPSQSSHSSDITVQTPQLETEKEGIGNSPGYFGIVRVQIIHAVSSARWHPSKRRC